MLTPRQEEAMRLVAVKGLTRKEAAAEMCITVSTIHMTLEAVHRRLGAKTTPHAVYLWLLETAKAREAEAS